MQQTVPITPELLKELQDGTDHYDAVGTMETLADIASSYFIGDIPVSACLGNIKLLYAIGSPLLCPPEEGEAAKDPAQSTVEAIYVLDKGEDAVQPLQRIAQKQTRVTKYMILANSNPMYLERVGALEDEIDELNLDFQRAARENYKRFEHLDTQEVLEGILSITDEITEILERIPEENSADGSVKKKG